MDSKLTALYNKIDREIEEISDEMEYINYYNGKYFVNIISNVSDDIDNLIDNEEYDNAFELIKHTYMFISDVFMDGSNGEHLQSFEIINRSASYLIENEKYFDLFLKYANEVIQNDLLGDYSDAPLHAFLSYAHDKTTAEKVIKVMDNAEFGYGQFINETADKIDLVYKYIDKDKAIEMCHENIECYGVKELLDKYLNEKNNI